jgi:hypothetical protein
MIENTLWKILAFIILTIMLFVVPLYFTFVRQDMITYQVVSEETEKLTDLICNLGYITPDMYSNFCKSIEATGLNYTVTIKHHKKQYYPVSDQVGEFFVDYELADTQEIIEALYPSKGELITDAQYVFALGDFIVLEIENQGKTKAEVLKDLLSFKKNRVPVIYVRSGGMVHNEND